LKWRRSNLPDVIVLLVGQKKRRFSFLLYEILQYMASNSDLERMIVQERLSCKAICITLSP
jgi:hypothetical protein